MNRLVKQIIALLIFAITYVIFFNKSGLYIFI